MPSKKRIARWYNILMDIKRAIADSADITPVNHELFMDYESIDILYYDEGTKKYISFTKAIQDGIVWKNPEASLDAIKEKYPSPTQMTVCAALDTNYVYACLSPGNWIPISSNSIPKASATKDGLMSKEHFIRVEGATKIIYLEQSQSIPAVAYREENTLYSKVVGSIAVDFSYNGKSLDIYTGY